MKIIIETPDFKPSASLKQFIKDKVSKLEKLHQQVIYAEVTLGTDTRKSGELIHCHLRLSLPGKDEFVKASSGIFEDAILKAVDHAGRRLRIRKTQMLDNRKSGVREKSR